MTLRTLVGRLALLLAAFVIDPTPADACSCMASGPACQAFWSTDAVFDAMVVSVEPLPRDGAARVSVPPADYLVSLDVRQAWKGVNPGPLEVVTSGSEASCGFEFKVGRRYLVFARSQADVGRLSVSHCSRTHEFDGTGDDAMFLASLASPETGAQVFGSIELSQSSFVSGRSTTTRTPVDLGCGSLATAARWRRRFVRVGIDSPASSPVDMKSISIFRLVTPLTARHVP
jgi:hypothetical protein